VIGPGVLVLQFSSLDVYPMVMLGIMLGISFSCTPYGALAPPTISPWALRYTWRNEFPCACLSGEPGLLGVFFPLALPHCSFSQWAVLPPF